MGLFSRIVDPYNTMGSSNPAVSEQRRVTLRLLARAINDAPDAKSRVRIEAYRDAVRANYAADFPVSDGSAYHNLTESDCLAIWGKPSGRADGTPRRP